MKKQQSKKHKNIFLYFRIVFVVCGIGWTVYWLRQENRWFELKQVILQLSPIVLAEAIGIYMVGHLLVAARWWLLLRTQAISIDFWAAVRLYFLGWFYNNFMPSSLGGDLVRAWYVTKHTHRRFEAALSVFVDRLVGLLSTLVIAGFFYFTFLYGKGDILPAGQSRQEGLIEKLVEQKITILFVFGLLALSVLVMAIVPKGKKILKLVYEKLKSFTVKMLNKLKKSIFLYCKRPFALLLTFIMTVFMQLMIITGFWLIGRDLGINADIKYYYVFFTLTWVLGALPISIGGAFVVEFLIVYFFVSFAGVPEEPAAALALCQRIIWMITSLPGAAIHLFGAHLPKDIFVDYEGSIE